MQHSFSHNMPLDDNNKDDKDPLDDLPKRYHSAAGWDGLDREERKKRAEAEKEREKYIKDHPQEFFQDSALSVTDAAEALDNPADEEAARPLFGDLFREGELAILFADTGVGKSVLAVQIADAISRGSEVSCLPSESSPPCLGGVSPPRRRGGSSDEDPPLNAALKVLYIDFELTNRQFAERYSTSCKNGRYIGKHKFRKNWFQRARIEWYGGLPDGFKSMAELLAVSVEREVFNRRPDVVIIDNITYLSEKPSATGPALRLMKWLKSFKDDNDISVLVLAHTTKRPYARPLTENDLQGSKMLANFADSLFAIGRDRSDPDLRYIKQVKTRSTRTDYGANNVITCRLVKTRGFLHFQFERFSDEHEHLTRPYDNAISTRESMQREARRLSANGLSQRAIAKRLNLSPTTVRRYLEED